MPMFRTFQKSLQAKLTAWSADYWPAVLSAFMLGVTRGPTNLYLLVFAALAPWLWMLRRAVPKLARKSGVVFGLIYFAFNMGWLQLFVGRWTGSPLLALLPTVLSVVLQVPYAVLFAGLANSAFRNDRAWCIPFAWAAVE